MECTGERYMPEVDGDWTLEHTHRYLLACELARDKAVLDIACGEGYGARMLADTAKSVAGVDISKESVELATARYPHPRLSFMQGDAVSIPLADASVDLVISFETIEHLADHDGMLREIKRVLRPGGLLLISSPDKYQYSDLPGFVNQYHVKELYRDEFIELLRERFKHTRTLGQRMVFGSLTAAEDEGSFLSWRKNEPNSRTVGLIDAEYILVLASDGPLPSLPSSLLKHAVDQSDKAREWARNLERVEADLGRAEADLARRRAWEEEARAYIRTLEREKEALEAKESELAGVYASNSWRLTEPLRQAGVYLRRVRRRALEQHAPVWPPDVRALEKQLVLRETEEQSALQIGVFLHIYHPDLAGEMLDCLRHLPATAQIHVSTDSEGKRDTLAALFSENGFGPRTELRVCPNQGWDIAPFLVGFADVIPRYPLLLRLHSKRSSHLPEGVGDAWRRMLFASLAGSVGRVNAVMRAFEEDSGLGMVCPPTVDYWADSVHFGGNFSQMRDLLAPHGIAISKDVPIDFPVGSMFWCRPNVVSPWLDKHFSYADFGDPDTAARDASLAHALERLFFFGCGIAGSSWARVAPPNV